MHGGGLIETRNQIQVRAFLLQDRGYFFSWQFFECFCIYVTKTSFDIFRKSLHQQSEFFDVGEIVIKNRVCEELVDIMGRRFFLNFSDFLNQKSGRLELYQLQ